MTSNYSEHMIADLHGEKWMHCCVFCVIETTEPVWLWSELKQTRIHKTKHVELICIKLGQKRKMHNFRKNQLLPIFRNVEKIPQVKTGFPSEIEITNFCREIANSLQLHSIDDNNYFMTKLKFFGSCVSFQKYRLDLMPSSGIKSVIAIIRMKHCH